MGVIYHRCTIGQDRTGQDRTGQDRTGQDTGVIYYRTGQGGYFILYNRTRQGGNIYNRTGQGGSI